MTICHRVQPLTQATQMSCWRACVNMILGYYGVTWQSEPARPAIGDDPGRPAIIRRQYNPNSPYTLPDAGTGSPGPQGSGVQRQEFGPMAEHYGFRPLDDDRIRAWWPARLDFCLRRYGPLWYAVQMPQRHVVVVTGVREEGTPSVSVNDPATGQKTFWSIDQLNRFLVDARNNPLYYPRGRGADGQARPGNQIVQTMDFAAPLPAQPAAA